MVVRNVEICPFCGQWDPWRKVSSRVVKGRRRVYVRCKRCGRPETVEYRQKNDETENPSASPP